MRLGAEFINAIKQLFGRAGIDVGLMKTTLPLLVFLVGLSFVVGVLYFSGGSYLAVLINKANAWIGLTPVAFDAPTSTACYGAAEDFCGPGAGMKNLVINALVDFGIVTALVFVVSKLKSGLKLRKS